MQEQIQMIYYFFLWCRLGISFSQRKLEQAYKKANHENLL